MIKTEISSSRGAGRATGFLEIFVIQEIAVSSTRGRSN